MAKNKVGLYLSVAIAKRQKYVPIVSTGNNKYKAGWGFVLGVFLIWGVGFSPIAALHNAAHDTRHSMAFPCH